MDIKLFRHKQLTNKQPKQPQQQPELQPQSQQQKYGNNIKSLEKGDQQQSPKPCLKQRQLQLQPQQQKQQQQQHQQQQQQQRQSHQHQHHQQQQPQLQQQHQPQQLQGQQQLRQLEKSHHRKIPFVFSEMATIIILTMSIPIEIDTEDTVTIPRQIATQMKIASRCAQNASGVLGRRLKRLCKHMKRRNGLTGVTFNRQLHLPMEQHMKAKVLFEFYGF